MLTCLHSVIIIVRSLVLNSESKYLRKKNTMGINEEEETAKYTTHNNTKCVLWEIRAKAQETAEHRTYKTKEHNQRAAV